MLGSGPGGYTAAFRAADLGLKVVLIERDPTLGGVCLNVGCIPSKALLHAAKVISEAEEMGHFGVKFAKPEVDIDGLRGWKESVVKKLTGGLSGLAKGRKVTVVSGVGTFTGPNAIRVEGPDGAKTVSFDQCVIAAGSEPVKLPFIPDDPRVIDSTGALELGGVPQRLLVIGGGIIGLEMACVYDALGAKITVVELMDQIIPGADARHRQAAAQADRGALRGDPPEGQGDRGEGARHRARGGDGGAERRLHRRLRPGAGRGRPAAERQGDRRRGRGGDGGRARVHRRSTTSSAPTCGTSSRSATSSGQPMLAHKAVHEGKVAAEVAAGSNRVFDARVIPSVAYTDPEVAWVGMTENEAKAKGVKVGKGVFPWAASGRSLSLGRDEGMTKVLFDEADDRVIGAGIVGPNAGDLIAEVALAIEMGADATDIGQTIHPHPTLWRRSTSPPRCSRGRSPT